MTDRQFLERMLELTNKMCDVYNAEPLDQEARLAVLAEIHETGVKFNRSKRRQAWFHLASIVVLACVLAYGFYIVLQLLKM